MKPIRLICMVLALAVLGQAPATSFPSYFDEHRQWCEDNRTTDKWARQMCATPAWCAVHQQEDRIASLTCDHYHSRANLAHKIIIVSAASLNASRPLNKMEGFSLRSEDSFWVYTRHLQDRTVELLPDKMPAAKLALRAEIWEGPFKPTVVLIGLESGSHGVMSITANENGNGQRGTRNFTLNGDDIEHLLAALNLSRFWQLPAQGGHLGAADGIGATVEVSIPGVRNRVTDAVGDNHAVDLSVLAHAIGHLAAARWQHIAVPD